jgi:hypothetical protein
LLAPCLPGHPDPDLLYFKFSLFAREIKRLLKLRATLLIELQQSILLRCRQLLRHVFDIDAARRIVVIAFTLSVGECQDLPVACLVAHSLCASEVEAAAPKALGTLIHMKET